MNSIKTFLIALGLFACSFAYSQAPQRMAYQSIIRNTGGSLVVSSAIGVKVSILRDSETGTVVYQETFNGSTNENGLLTLEIGGGTPVSGTFSAIDWTTGIYFVKTETDPAGGTNYSITGIGQLLSVPYAFYAAGTPNQGKTSIVLTGDITNAEAAAQIARESGYNTENILIINTTQLTTVDFPAITGLLTIDVSENASLTNVSFSALTKIFRDVDIKGNPNLAQINFPVLKNIYGKDFSINSNILLQTISMPLLETASSAYCRFISNYALTQLSLGALQKAATIDIINNIGLTSISLPQLTKCSSTLNIQGNLGLTSVNLNLLNQVSVFAVHSNPLITNLSFPQATSFSNVGIENCAALQSVSMPLLNGSNFVVQNVPALTSLNLAAFDTGDLMVINSGLTTFSLPNLHHPRSVSLTGNSQLTSVDFSTIQSVETSLGATYNPNLTAINFPNNLVIGIGAQPGSIYLNNNRLNSTVVNSVLNKAVNYTPATGHSYYLQDQSPAAPPTGQGLIDKQTLINNGNNVTTD
jgi:hypothetical protein